jgi:hypothetical protein
MPRVNGLYLELGGHYKKEAELNLVNSNKLLDESERIAKTGVGNLI